MALIQRLRSNSAVLLFFGCTLLTLCIPIKTPLNIYDEGFAVFNATRVMNGDLPYQDFWAIYPPGQFYILAAVFKAVGVNLLAARIYDTLVRGVLALAITLIGRKITGPMWAWLAGLTSVLLLATDGAYSYAVFPALALGLLAVLSLLEYLERRRWQWLFLAGALAGAAALFRWDIALYAAASLVGVILLGGWFAPGLEGKRPQAGLRETSKRMVIVLAGVLGVALPCYGVLSALSGFGNVWDQVVVFPVTELPALRWKPYPPLFPFRGELAHLTNAYARFLYWLRFYLPVFVFGVGWLSYGFSLLKKRLILDKRHLGRIVMLIFGALLFSQALSRYDAIHVLPTSLLVFLALFWMADGVFRQKGRGLLKFAALVALVGLLAVTFALPVERLVYFARAYSPFECHSKAPRAGCVALSGDQEAALEYLHAQAKEGEPIFVGNQRHDLISVMDISFYFLSGHPSATFYHELYPGVATTRAVQKVIASEIQAQGVNWIVLVNTGRSYDPNASSISSGVHYLDNAIRSGYAPVAEFGIYQIWARLER